ncbi:BIG1-domain-containing protein [Zopfia rhizophila CBS 207.26]|uniref:Protein BIG1 n=1 Tax=Zopfia rhizophila CBS 207.26 TaxID=1314779 RepID=A0A6A6DGK3_9PEZI|nr:BIG1-domain-containing protein [Zopfia rhizophila CBS 207.26]
MAKTLIGAVALAALPSAIAFRNSSPFFLFSTSTLDVYGNDAEVARSTRLTEAVIESLRDCPSDTYVLVQQDGVSSVDYLHGQSAPRLGLYLGGGYADVKTTMTVPEVVGSIDTSSIYRFLESQCGAKGVQVDGAQGRLPTISPKNSSPRVVEVHFPAPAIANRALTLDKYDSFLEKLLTSSTKSEPYTVIYTTTAQTSDATFQNQHTYEMDDPFGEAVHMELKRDTGIHRKAAPQSEGALFERYQYLSPGLFMGLTAVVPLFFILYFGLSAISSLEVSYYAFSKEMGPSAQKKQ